MPVRFTNVKEWHFVRKKYTDHLIILYPDFFSKVTPDLNQLRAKIKQRLKNPYPYEWPNPNIPILRLNVIRNFTKIKILKQSEKETLDREANIQRNNEDNKEDKDTHYANVILNDNEDYSIEDFKQL